MRIGHATDIHWMVTPSLGDLSPKRILGSTNLFVRGRSRDFSESVQQALVDHFLAQKLDLLILTGDLTAQGLDAEFAKARAALDPLLKLVPTFVIPGNHDTYTRGAAAEQRIRKHFSDVMGLGDGAITRFDQGNLTVLGLDPNRPQLLLSSGAVPADQLAALEAALADPALRGRRLILCLHYPILDRKAAYYEGRGHGLLNARALVDVLERAPIRPEAILHGHVHHGYQVDLALSNARIPIFNPGSGGYAHQPARHRAGAAATYTLVDDGIARERFVYDGTLFVPEPGGAWATGR